MTTRRTFPRKILYSPGYGAGWSTWAIGKWIEEKEMPLPQFLAEYEPIITFLENGGDKKSREFQRLLDELEELLNRGVDYSPYFGGAQQLRVTEVNGPYRIEEYDGSESVIEQDNPDLWFY